MIRTARRLLLVLAASSGTIVLATPAADAGVILGNHCEPQLSTPDLSKEN